MRVSALMAPSLRRSGSLSCYLRVARAQTLSPVAVRSLRRLSLLSTAPPGLGLDCVVSPASGAWCCLSSIGTTKVRQGAKPQHFFFKTYTACCSTQAPALPPCGTRGFSGENFYGRARPEAAFPPAWPVLRPSIVNDLCHQQQEPT